MSASVKSQIENEVAKLATDHTALAAGVAAAAAELAKIHAEIFAARPKAGEVVSEELASAHAIHSNRLHDVIQDLHALLHPAPQPQTLPVGAPEGLVFDSTMNLWKDPVTGAHWDRRTLTMTGGTTPATLPEGTPTAPRDAPPGLELDPATGLWTNPDTRETWDSTLKSMVPPL